MKLVIVSGLSGAGKTVALKQYEDLGFDCIDNLPLALLEDLVHRSLAEQPPRYEALAIGVDARERPDEIHRFPHYIERLRAQGVELRVLFLTTSIQILLQRYSETRRRHPLSTADRPLTEAIEREQRLLEPIANTADAVIDTTDLNLYALRERIQAEIPGGGRDKLAITLVSFGFKHGAPADADFVFDVRCLPNPHWNRDLRPMSGQEPPVAAWLAEHQDVQNMRADLLSFLRTWLPRFRSQDRAYLTVAIGCTGGKHRSVFLVDEIAAALRSEYAPLTVRHRELDRRRGGLP
jgi:RNase adapter protein RapZ